MPCKQPNDKRNPVIIRIYNIYGSAYLPLRNATAGRASAPPGPTPR